MEKKNEEIREKREKLNEDEEPKGPK